MGKSGLTLEAAEPWAPHPLAAPRTEREDERLLIAANGTRTLSGGWQVRYAGVEPGRAYSLQTEVTCEGVACPRDHLLCVAAWSAPPAGDAGPRGFWDYLLPEYLPDGRVRFARTLIAPPDASCVTVRCTLRWTSTGRTVWTLPRVVETEAPAPRPPVKVCVVTGHAHARAHIPKTVQGNLEFYARLCEAACAARPNLVVLPEICLQWGVPGHAVETALPAPGPETDVFARIARQYRVRICLPLIERDGDAVHNSALLISPHGEIDGRYRKVHLAVGGEAESGILPGDGFPVFQTEIGRLGCNICMDTSAAESSRMVGLNGADFLLMPIMGDHRADRFTRGTPIFNES
ncbi:MAG: carbon-nitrogen hydrolase family protein, partial [Armatimonadota bacterium]|nr:carbon-nitrogen hydrolase family protein [Armatimonadota bacterium]